MLGFCQSCESWICHKCYNVDNVGRLYLLETNPYFMCFAHKLYQQPALYRQCRRCGGTGHVYEKRGNVIYSKRCLCNRDTRGLYYRCVNGLLSLLRIGG